MFLRNCAGAELTAKLITALAVAALGLVFVAKAVGGVYSSGMKANGAFNSLGRYFGLSGSLFR